MSGAAGVALGLSGLAMVAAVSVGYLLWSSRLDRKGESAEDRYRRSHMDLHSPRNRRAMKARERRNRWAAGSGGAASGAYYGLGSDGGGGGS